MNTRITRRGLVMAAAPAAGALAAACGGTSGGATTSQPALTGPKEINFVGYQSDPLRQSLFDQAWKAAGAAAGVTVNGTWEASADYWTKRHAEFASGATGVDVMVLNNDWVLPGGFNGMFPDHSEFFKRDKVDLKQFYPAALASWAWKGKQWALPFQAGGEMVLFNKKLFDAKGVKYPNKGWTYDDFLAACQKLNDPANNKFAVDVQQNGLHYMMGTFVLNFGGKLLNDTKDKALYGDDPNAIAGASLDVDLTQKYKYTPTAEAKATLPAGTPAFDAEMAAMEINGSFRHTPARTAIGVQNLDFAPPPKGKVQMATVGGNAWAMSSLSKAQEAAWRCLKWLFSKEGQANEPLLKAVSWPAIVATASTPQWLEIFKGTPIDDVSAVWQNGGHDLMGLPEGSKAWTTANTPMNDALAGKNAAQNAMQESPR